MLWFLPCFSILDRVMIHLNRADMEITPDVSCYSVVQVTLLISRKKTLFCYFLSYQTLNQMKLVKIVISRKNALDVL